ncbi:MAG: hypothetical protein MZU91_01815 [Desulfosudis oleivorans]|nr:hypothetical protein [Desulfosudis oleivorans]
MAGEKVTRRQKDISRLIKERSKISKDKIKRDKGKRNPEKDSDRLLHTS